MGDFCYLSAENYATRYSVTVPEGLSEPQKYVYIYIYIYIYINIVVNLTLPTH